MRQMNRRRVLQAMALTAAMPATASKALAATQALHDLGAREAVTQIRRGELKAERYVEALLERYRAHKNLNTVISLDEARVLEQARAVDKARTRGESLGALAGLPFMVKDQIEVAGYHTTAGTAALKAYRSKKSAPVVDSMLRAGGVMFAKANLQELAQGPTSSNPTFGFVRNPYDIRRIPGGSSGGNAAALAARIVPAGLGEDTGGSIRIPAALCGVSGLRPSTGGARKRYPDAGIVPPARADDLQTIGPMARTVGDVALLDEVITGERVTPLRTLRGVRIGVPRSRYWEREDVDTGVARSTRDAYAKLTDAGATLVEIDLDALVALGDTVAPALASSDRDADFAAWLEQNLPGVTLEDVIAGITSKDVKASREARLHAAPTTGLSPAERAALRKQTTQRYADVFRINNIVALAFPSVPVPPPLIQPNGDVPQAQIEVNGKSLPRNAVLIRNTWWGARMGAPGLIVPAGMSAGLPIGLELEALPDGDSALLALGMAIEKVLGPLPAPTLRQAVAFDWRHS
jgi:indoleacetamide hydrolase